MQPNGPDYSTRAATRVIDEVRRERVRQIKAEGWTPEHDDAHDRGQMADAAACYLIADWPTTSYVLRPIVRRAYARYTDDADHEIAGHRSVPRQWPWEAGWWKPKDRRRDLVRAAALLIAEIERLDRAAAIVSDQHGT